MIEFGEVKPFGIAILRKAKIVGWIVNTNKGYATEGVDSAKFNETEMKEIESKLDQLNQTPKGVNDCDF